MNQRISSFIKKGLPFLGMAIYILLNVPSAQSQTFRIKVGTLTNGSSLYTDVYEYDYVEEKPEFPGGRSSMINYINSQRCYPQEAYQLGIEGRVTCAFVVYPDGKISNIKVLKGVESSLNKEAVRLISEMPDWKPGKIHDRAVPVRVVCCIPFRK